MHRLMKRVFQLLVLVSAPIWYTSSFAQYPVKPLRWYVPLAAGGPIDTMTRAIAAEVASGLGQVVVVENRPGASGIAATEALVRSAPDGYSVLTAAAGIVVFHKLVYRNLPYDPQRDLAPIGLMHDNPVGIFVNASVPATSIQELVAYAKANPGKLSYGSSGQGQPYHLAIELFQRLTTTKMVHVPYKGAAQFIPDLAAGRIDLILFPPVGQVMALVKTGKLRLIAVDMRLPSLTGVPTFAEAGLGDFGIPSWVGALAPRGTPREIIERLNAELHRAVSSPPLAKLFAQMGTLSRTSSPDQFAQLISKEIAKWGELVTSLNIEPQ